MWKRFCNWLLYKHLGWKKHITVAHPAKYIICLAPHTSNWDFILGQLYSGAEGWRIGFLMKKEWFFWPLGVLFRRLGGIPVQRKKHTSMTDMLAAEAQRAETFHLCITPEGTRSATKEWKRGFLVIARKAQLPVLLYGVDYERKLIECTEMFTPSDDIEGDMAHIKAYFKNYRGKYPEKFDY